MSVRHALLALLREAPKYGLQLRQEFEARTGEAWPLNVGQVYTTLQRLERDGLVESDDEADGPQRSFRITDAGDDELQSWLRAPTQTVPPRDELVIKVMVALAVPGVDVGELVQLHRRSLVALLQRYTRLKEDVAPHEMEVALVLDAELYRIDGMIRWLDSVDARIKQRPSTPGPDTPALVRRRRRLGARS
jgi:DNA-binding PadR family transcriptional regulator